MVAGLMACSTMSRTPVADTKQKRRYLLSWTRLLRSATRARSSRNASRKSSTVAIRFPSRPQRSPIWATSPPSRKPPSPPSSPVPRSGSSWTAQGPLRVAHDFRDGAARPRPVQGRTRGASSGNWITTASKGPGEMTSVVWPLPVVSSMSQVSPALIVTASPTPGVTRTLPARQKRIWRAGVR